MQSRPLKVYGQEHHANHNIDHVLCIHQTASANYHFNAFKIILRSQF